MDDKNLVNDPQSLRNHESPISTPGTSRESSNLPPAQPNENMTNINPTIEHQVIEGIVENNGILARNLSHRYSRLNFLACHICQFVAETKEEYDKHVDSHMKYKCTHCSRMLHTKGHLECHTKNHLAEIARYSLQQVFSSIENGNRSSSEDVSPGSEKDRTTKCKTCYFVGKNKSELYAHLRKRVCFTGPLLECEFEQCQFCTKYKHHFEYHQRNHSGCKPVKCDQCNYVCNNQSMLTSHMKSHSSQQPYKCKTCTYATKYLHTIKQHGKKYNHELDIVLIPVRTESRNLKIDANGNNRSSKSKKANSSNTAVYRGVSTLSTPHTRPPSANYHQSPTLLSSNHSLMYNNPMFNKVAGNGLFLSPIYNSSMSTPVWNFKCTQLGCDYAVDSKESMQQHLMEHINSRRQYLYERNFNAFSPELRLLLEDTRKLNSRSQNWNGSTSSTQADTRIREFADFRGVPIPLKWSENSIAEYGVGRVFSPPLSYTDIAPDSFLARHTGHPAQENFIENRERFNILRCSSISPPCMEQTSSRSSIGSEDADDFCSPLDLTINTSMFKPKVVNSLRLLHSAFIASEQEKKRQNVESVSIPPQQTTKRRRKGKAFKIDQSVQYEE